MSTMDDPSAAEPATAPDAFKTRETLARRLADIVCLPTSRITPQERHIAADLLVDMLNEATPDFRLRCAQRIAGLPEAPSVVLRRLATDEPAISEPVLLESKALSDADLAAVARTAGVEQRVQIAKRRGLTPLVTEIIVERNEAPVIETLLNNRFATLSEGAVDRMVRVSRDHLHFAPLLSRRQEIKPNQALTLFWWADAATRKQLLLRFGVGRHILQDASGDVFASAAESGWSDPVARKALQFIERRQRNRGAIDRSPFDSLEDAVAAVAEQGFSRALAEEVSYLAGIKPATGVRILTDLGGEPIAVLCKAAGVRRPSFDRLWSGLGRPMSTETETDPIYEHVIDVFESIATDKAQTVLRYWNWTLTSAMSPERAMSVSYDAFDESSVSVAERAAELVWGQTRALA